MCRIEDADSASCYSQRVRRAAKPYSCSECSRTIRIGETYQYVFMVSENEPMTFHTCEHCLTATKWLARECGGYVFGQVLEEIEEHAAEYPDIAPQLAPLAEGIRKQWISDGALMPIMAVPDSISVHF